MRYVPNLIPPSAKVLPDYFKGGIYGSKSTNRPASISLWTAAILLFIFAFASLSHPLLALFIGSIGFILLPPGKRFIESKLRFRMTPAIRIISCGTLLILIFPLSSHYVATDEKSAIALREKTDKEAMEKAAAAKAAQDKKDSLLYYLKEAVAMGRGSATLAATQKIDYAARFAASDSEKTLITKARTQVKALQLGAQIKAGDYVSALPAINDLISSDPNNTEMLYQRAICYNKMGQTADAVHDLASLVAAGHEDAIRLHDQINPLTKHVSYYTTRCRDGSTSSAKGKGACSRHGGVADWNEAVYETSRKY